MENLLRSIVTGGQRVDGGGGQRDVEVQDTAEQIYISALSLLKMLKHGRAGVPMEVMGLMLGRFVDEYTVTVVDVFAMPQSGTGVSVEAVDPVFQAKMLDMLKQTGRPETVVGWYHSHPGFGCWLSGVRRKRDLKTTLSPRRVDISTQQSFEQLAKRAVAVVIDPIQSVKGKVVIDAFRLIGAGGLLTRHESRQVTSMIGHQCKPSTQAIVHGLNRHYYSIGIQYLKNDLETWMLLNLHRENWSAGWHLADFKEHEKQNVEALTNLKTLGEQYVSRLNEEEKFSEKEMVVKNVGRKDPKRHVNEEVDELLLRNVSQCIATMISVISLE
ncbi:hypothetical protein ACOME3_007677 [Neoechinorhynchus agilis]